MWIDNRGLGRSALSVVIILTLSACVSSGGGTRAGSTVEHVVICWLKQKGDPAGRRRLIEAAQSFRALPGVQGVKAGPVLPTGRAVADSSFDLAIVVTVTDRAALARDLEHPAHQQVLDEVVRPLVQRLVVYDFVD